MLLLGSMLCGTAFGQELQYLRHQAWGTEEGLPQDSVHAILQSKDGYIWVATEGGLIRFDGISFKIYGKASNAAFASDDICCLAEDDDGSLLIGTSSGWLRMRQERFERVATPARQRNDLPRNLSGIDTRVQAVLVDREGLKWIGTRNGLQVVNPRTGLMQSVEALRGDSILSLFEDAEGNHWIGTETSGLHVLRRLKFRSEPGLAGLAITSVAEAEDGSIWIGTRDDGLRRVSAGVVTEPASVESLTSGVALCLLPAEAGGVWMGTPDGLNHVRADGTVEKLTSADGLPDDYVRALARGPDSQVWVGTGHGLALVRQGKVLRTLTSADGLPGDEIGALLVTPAGNHEHSERLWVATSAGVSVVDSDRINNANMPAWIHADTAAAFAQDDTGTVWAATKDGRLGQLAGSHTDNLAVDFGGTKIVGMIADHAGNLWLRMSQGIWRVKLVDLDRCAENGGCTSEQLPLFRYSRADGLPNDESVAGRTAENLLTRNGEVWFPTRRGVGIVDSRHLALNPVAPPVSIQRVLLDDVELGSSGELRLPYGQRRLTFDYAGLSFLAPSEVHYQVKLVGFDKDWVDVHGLRSATYTNLAAGRYTFQVQAANGDGVWNRHGAEIHVRVVPPYWRRWWFVASMFVAAGAIFVSLYLVRLQRLRRDFSVVLGERNRMAREIHDTLTQDFVGTSVHLDILAQMLRKRNVEAALEQVTKTRKLVTEGLEEARRSIWELRANQSGDELPSRVCRLVEREEWESLGVKVKVGGAVRALSPTTEREILRVLQEALQNVKRHARANETSVHLHYSDEAVLLTIEDNGVGFRMEDVQEGHFGLIGMKERAEVVAGHLEITSLPGKGTKVILRVSG